METNSVLQPKTTPGALTANQVHAITNSQLGRDATPYEVSTLSTAPIQTLANLKTSYSKLNPNSITDYLTFIGEDPSLQNRMALGQKYGIANVGTAEGNTALLNALKSGQQPAPPTVSGSITPPTPAPVAKTPQQLLDEQNNGQNFNVGGSVASAATSTPETNGNSTPDQDPAVVSAKSIVDQATKDRASLIQQRDELNNNINSAMEDKRKEIAQAGGSISESQLRSLVLTESAPLLQERNYLDGQISEANSNISQYNKDYNDALSSAYKNANLGINEQKLSDTESKTQFTEQQQLEKTNNSLITKYPDANILPTDDPATMLAKLENSPMYLATLGAKVKSGTIQPKLLITTDSSGNQSVIAINPKTGSILSTTPTGGIAPATIPSTTTSQVPFSLVNPGTWFGETTTKTTVKGGSNSSNADPLNLNQ